MRKILTILTILLMFQFSATVSALEDCPTNVNAMWTDCVGTYTFGPNSEWAGDQYSGEFKDDKKHGLGTYTYADGTSETGMWRNGKLISDVCKDMGLSPNTEAYGKCILKMMD